MQYKRDVLEFVSRNWPFANGSGRLIDKFGTDIDLGRGETTCRTSDGFDMSVLSDDLIGRHIILSGKFDRSIVLELSRHGRPGDVILDVGANIGYVGCLLLKLVPDSVVHFVEPQPDLVDLLRRNAARFGEARSHVVQAALSDRASMIEMQIDRENRGRSSISLPIGEETISVATLSTDDYLAGFDRLDLLKIDVEGHETVLFTNAERQLARLKPRAILFECANEAAAPDGAIGSLLARIGYQVFGVRKALLKTSLAPINSVADCRYNDYIALRRS